MITVSSNTQFDRRHFLVGGASVLSGVSLLHGPALAAGPAAGAANRCDILLPLPPLEAP